MKKIITSLLIGVLSLNISAQETAESPDKDILLAIGVTDPEGVTDANASRTLKNNITQALVLNGTSATSGRFTVLPSVAVTSLDVTNTIPSKFVAELEVSLFLGDLYTQTLMSQTSFTVKGVGNTESQAYMSAIRNIQARSPKLKTFILTGKEKIMEYFRAEGPGILNRVRALISKGDYHSAVLEALAIPSACTDLYDQASELLATIPQEKKKEEEKKITKEDLEKYFYSCSEAERAKGFSININMPGEQKK